MCALHTAASATPFGPALMAAGLRNRDLQTGGVVVHRRASLRAALCQRTLVGHALSLPVVFVLGYLFLVSLMGDRVRGAPSNRALGSVSLSALLGLLLLQAAIPIWAMRSLRQEHPEAMRFRAAVLAVASVIGWAAGSYFAASVGALLPTWLSPLDILLLGFPSSSPLWVCTSGPTDSAGTRALRWAMDSNRMPPTQGGSVESLATDVSLVSRPCA